ncbi:solute carrier family 22 member 4-like isoform X1 [Poeciliopsis prolifica]|uniref:solute carrier family 22 member 4-like isoform X1 n=1 Tax=Poeciliopsis prolifica TaxID=188132 RepID=UPI0024136103|nr:solute carrier family 22 member 4-like isoform X1 [Poeciliopsis prolifica]XP_054887325.1 solute carrier family 22 member 4-like isoform X1 [Poeciliopsis prolifica]
MQDYEESVLFLGSWGPFQRRIFFVLSLACVPCGYNILSVIFLLASPPHHCNIPAHSNLSQEWIQAIIPVEQVAGQPEKSSCSRYELDLVRNLSAFGVSPNWLQNQSASESRPEALLSQLKREACRDGWNYSTEHFQSTVVTEFDLVCSDQWKQPLTSLVYFLGGLSGCFISGLISDRFGRKPVLFGSIAVLSIFSSAVALAPSWPVFTVLFFMLGLGQIASYIAVFVLGSEILVGSSRILFSSLGQPFVYVSSMMLLPGTAYLVRSWRHLSLIMAVPGLACIPLWWLVPESPRWLLSRGRLQEAELLLRSAALENQVEAPPVIFLPPKAEKSATHQAESVSFLDLLKTANIRHITLKLWLIWFSMSASYFGLSFSMSTLYGNPFLNYFLFTAVELPAYFASWLAARSFPRRLSFIGFSLLGALALLFIQGTMKSYPTLTMSLVLLGKFGILAGNGVMYIYTGELSPTVIRNTAMSSCAMFSRVGSSVSPYLLEMAEFNKLLPWITLGALSLLGVLLCIFLPETFRQPLPDTIEQMPVMQWFACPWACKTALKEEEKIAKKQTPSIEIIYTTCL